MKLLDLSTNAAPSALTADQMSLSIGHRKSRPDLTRFGDQMGTVGDVEAYGLVQCSEMIRFAQRSTTTLAAIPYDPAN